MRRVQPTIVLALALLAALAAACGGPAAPTAETTPLPAPDAAPEGRPEGSIEAIFATTVLRVGTQRAAFLLAGEEVLVKAPFATVTTSFLGEGDAAGETREATFHLWPYGVRGAYSTRLTFPLPGPWQLDIAVDDGGVARATQLVVDVKETVIVREVGTVAPLSFSKTLSGEASLEAITSDFTPDPELYRLTIAEAVISGDPSVIVFATPAFCTSPTCGPQVDTVSELRELHPDGVNFIHVEFYDNPDEIQGDLSRGRVSSIADDWGISTIPGWFNESWVFVLGRDGRIAERFEGFASLAELEAALLDAL